MPQEKTQQAQEEEEESPLADGLSDSGQFFCSTHSREKPWFSDDSSIHVDEYIVNQIPPSQNEDLVSLQSVASTTLNDPVIGLRHVFDAFFLDN